MTTINYDEIYNSVKERFNKAFIDEEWWWWRMIEVIHSYIEKNVNTKKFIYKYGVKKAKRVVIQLELYDSDDDECDKKTDYHKLTYAVMEKEFCEKYYSLLCDMIYCEDEDEDED
jgi:hypothetical protein